MTRMQLLEREVRKLPRADLSAFREWFRRYDAASWDRQLERDVRSRRLDSLAAQAVSEHRRGKTRAL